MKAPGEFDSRGRYWSKCPFCGDTRGHLVVNTSGVYYCFRCGTSGYLPLDVHIRMFGWGHVSSKIIYPRPEDEIPEHPMVLLRRLAPGPASSRKSKLQRYHLGNLDAFLMRDPSGRLTGIHLRGPGISKSVGRVSFGFRGPRMPMVIRLVEGPYDVCYDEDVATFGLPTGSQLSALRDRLLILTPDGDVWTNPMLLKRYVKTLFKADVANNIWKVEILPSGKDPDEVPVEEREAIDGSEFRRFVRNQIPELSTVHRS